MLSVDNSNFQNDARETRMKGLKIVDEHRLLDQDRSCFNGDEMNLLENIGRAILLTDPGKLTIFVIVHSSNQRCENAPFHLWLTTATILVYRILIIEYRIEKRHKKKANVNRQILLGCSFYSHRYWNCFQNCDPIFGRSVGFDIKFIRFNMELIFGKYDMRRKFLLQIAMNIYYLYIVKLICKFLKSAQNAI